MKKRTLVIALIIIAGLAFLAGVIVLTINALVVSSARSAILSPEEAAAKENIDCILVLGCRVYEDGSLSHMLQDRLQRGLELYLAGAAPKLLMSGDHGQKDYDEVNAMKRFAIEKGVPSEDVL